MDVTVSFLPHEVGAREVVFDKPRRLFGKVSFASSL